VISTYKILLGKPERKKERKKKNLGDLGVDGKLILRR
jgi:hypothetical protein